MRAHKWQNKQVYHYQSYVIEVKYLGNEAYQATRLTTGQHMVARLGIRSFDPYSEMVQKLVKRLEVYENKNNGYCLTGQICDFEGKQDFTFTGLTFDMNSYKQRIVKIQHS